MSARHLALFALLAAAGLLLHLGACGLTEPDEARYASVAREMESSGDWLIPRLYGRAHLTKPPLTYWLAAASLRILGPHEWAARLPAALAGLGCAWFTFALGRRLWGHPAGLASGLILLGCPLFFVMARILDPNMLLALSTTMALWAATAVRQQGRHSHRLLFYAALALSFLAKGPVGAMIVLLALGGARLLRGPAPSAGRLWSWPHAALCALLSAAWFAAVISKHPEATDVFLQRELVERVMTEEHDRSEPWWFYLPLLPAAVLPWLPVIAAGFVRTVRSARRDAASGLLLAWVALPLAVFTLSGSKVVTYILPLLPPLALAGGRALAAGLDGRIGTAQAVWAPVVAAALLPAVGLVGVRAYGWTGSLVPSDAFWLLPAGIALAAALTGPPVRRWFGAASLLLCAFLAAYVMVGRNDAALHPHSSVRAMADALRPELCAGDRIVLLNRFPRGLRFYLDAPVAFPSYKFPLDVREDRARIGPLVFDEAVEVYRWFDSTQRVFVVLSERALDNMNRAVRVPARVLFDDGRMLVVSNRPVN